MINNEKTTTPIKVAIAGVGNCASSLVQGVSYYGASLEASYDGIMLENIGTYRPQDITFVAAFDIDVRKVGRPIAEAIFAEPNCTRVICEDVQGADAMVQMGPVLDGFAPHMNDYNENEAFRVANAEAVDVVQVLKESKADVLVCYLPVGSEEAVKTYADAALKAGVAFINCVPVFIASQNEWANKFEERGIPIIGDDIKSQLGATITHRVLAKLFSKRGIKIKRTYQLNTGGNTDFLNMLAQDRLKSKKKSKTNSVQSQLDTPLDAENIHIGPSDYVPWQKDNKVAFIRLEGEGFGGAPLELEMRLSVQDSPNSAGVVIDAIRCAKLALDRKIGGALIAPSALYMKTPPVQIEDYQAFDMLDIFIKG
ncbi:inositol-3-phosphate synthase [Terasakiella pusilla]|uniref:inositol-3-phosphate synthase n=1 Tax=Terasakiella pusilla TaxID=64973 RepID=UPI00048CA8AE|nr:inositol-3-phosphate synthase [Terasakiella pusilla]